MGWPALEAIMALSSHSARALSDAQIRDFVTDGFVRIDGAFPAVLAEAARTILWRDIGCDPVNPATWTRPVARLGMYSDPPFSRRPTRQHCCKPTTSLPAKAAGCRRGPWEHSRSASPRTKAPAMTAGMST